MDQKKADRLQRHQKELRRRAWLNLVLMMAFAVGLGLLLGGPIRGSVAALFGEATSGVIVFSVLGLLWIAYSIPFLHFREEYTIRSDREPEYFLERGLDRLPLVMLLEEQGWEEVEATKDRIRLETYPTALHRLLNRRSTIELEVEEQEDSYEVSVLRSGGKNLERTISEIEPTDNGGSRIHEVGVSLSRVSPARLEVLLVILPKLQEMLEDAAEDEMEIIDEDLEYGLSAFELPT